MRLPAVCHRAAQRTANRWHDLRAVAVGYCNHQPWHPNPDRGGGGYPHWRCALKRRHKGYHRYNEYVWLDDLQVQHAPMRGAPLQPWLRTTCPTMRQERVRRRWDRQAQAQRSIQAGGDR